MRSTFFVPSLLVLAISACSDFTGELSGSYASPTQSAFTSSSLHSLRASVIEFDNATIEIELSPEFQWGTEFYLDSISIWGSGEVGKKSASTEIHETISFDYSAVNTIKGTRLNVSRLTNIEKVVLYGAMGDGYSLILDGDGKQMSFLGAGGLDQLSLYFESSTSLRLNEGRPRIFLNAGASYVQGIWEKALQIGCLPQCSWGQLGFTIVSGVFGSVSLK